MSMAITEMLRLQAVERLAQEQARELADLRARVDAVEAGATGTQPAHTEPGQLPERLREINSTRQTACNALRAAIRRIVTHASDPGSITAKAVAQALRRAGYDPLPSERTIRLRLAEVRAEVATHGNTAYCQKTA